MTRVFNTEFETSLKILLLLFAVEPESLTIDRIIYYDFISTYGHSFGVCDINLNGENSYRYEEIGARRIRAKQAIKTLVLDKMIVVNKTPDGFHYKIPPVGISIAKTLTSDYAKKYTETVKETNNRYHAISDIELVSEINRKSVQLIRGE